MADQRPLADGDRVRLRAGASDYADMGLTPGDLGVVHKLRERDGVASADVKLDRPDVKHRVTIRCADLEII
jgi:hypothetical protein